MAPIAIASSEFAERRGSTLAPSSSQMTGLANCRARITRRETGAARSSALGPATLRARPAASVVRPRD